LREKSIFPAMDSNVLINNLPEVIYQDLWAKMHIWPIFHTDP